MIGGTDPVADRTGPHDRVPADKHDIAGIYNAVLGDVNDYIAITRNLFKLVHVAAWFREQGGLFHQGSSPPSVHCKHAGDDGKTFRS